MKRRRALFVALIILMFTMASTAIASTYSSYDMTVGRLGGTNNTGNRAKASSCTNIALHVTATGANYDLEATARTLENRQVGPMSVVRTGSVVQFPDSTNCAAGQLRSITFKNNYVVAVQTTGNWTPG